MCGDICTCVPRRTHTKWISSHVLPYIKSEEFQCKCKLTHVSVCAHTHYSVEEKGQDWKSHRFASNHFTSLSFQVLIHKNGIDEICFTMLLEESNHINRTTPSYSLYSAYAQHILVIIYLIKNVIYTSYHMKKIQTFAL